MRSFAPKGTLRPWYFCPAWSSWASGSPASLLHSPQGEVWVLQGVRERSPIKRPSRSKATAIAEQMKPKPKQTEGTLNRVLRRQNEIVRAFIHRTWSRRLPVQSALAGSRIKCSRWLLHPWPELGWKRPKIQNQGQKVELLQERHWAIRRNLEACGPKISPLPWFFLEADSCRRSINFSCLSLNLNELYPKRDLRLPLKW